MKQILLSLCVTSFLCSLIHAEQPISDVASNLVSAFSAVQKSKLLRSFDDKRRKTWDRIPKVREGLKMDEMNREQKTLLHELLRACLTREGYLLVTSVMFNEDIQQKFEPELGRNAFWLEVFGDPKEGESWGFQLEGHHLSLNLTFKGSEMVSHTPFLMGSNPQVADSDDHRNGLCFIYEEEKLAGQLVDSLSAAQKDRAYVAEGQPENMYGEITRESLKCPDEGIPFEQLSKKQRKLISKVLQRYAVYFPKAERLAKQSEIEKAKFHFIGETTPNGKHYFRIKSPNTLIECENYGNHTHHLWRSTNDYADQSL